MEIKKVIKSILITSVFIITAITLLPNTAYAQACRDDRGCELPAAAAGQSCCPNYDETACTVLPANIPGTRCVPQAPAELPGMDYKDFGDFETLLSAVRGLLIPLGMIIALILFIKCGYSYMTSEGDPYKLKDAKECLTSAIIGLVVVLLSVSILNTLINSTITKI